MLMHLLACHYWTIIVNEQIIHVISFPKMDQESITMHHHTLLVKMKLSVSRTACRIG